MNKELEHKCTVGVVIKSYPTESNSMIVPQKLENRAVIWSRDSSSQCVQSFRNLFYTLFIAVLIADYLNI